MRFILTLMILVTLVCNATGQEAKYKALFIYKFIRNMEWPEEKLLESYTIAILGDSKLIGELTSLADGRTVNGKNIRVIEYSSAMNMDDIHLLFISKDQSDQFESFSLRAKNNSVLLVTESPGFCTRGAPINFNYDSDRLRYEMNLTNLASAKIKASSSITTPAILIN